MSGTAERICAKFTERRAWSLARKSLNVKVKGQRTRSQRTKTGFSGDISKSLICDKFARKTCLVPRSSSLKVKVNFRGLHGVYVWKYTFALVSDCISVHFCKYVHKHCSGKIRGSAIVEGRFASGQSY